MLRQQTEQLKKQMRRGTLRNDKESRRQSELMTNFISRGLVYFPGNEEPSKFVCTTGGPSREAVQHLLTSIWALKPPTLVISLIGSAGQLNKRFKATLKNGLWKAAESGGEAVRDYTEAYGEGHISMLAVVPSKRVAFYDHFIASSEKTPGSSDRKVYYPDQQPCNETDEEDSCPSTRHNRTVGFKQKDVKMHDLEKVDRLNADHDYFIIVDQESDMGPPSSRLSFLQARIIFERTVLTWSKSRTSTTPIVVDGHGQKSPRIEQPTSGTGGAADILANVIEFMNFKMTLEENAISANDVKLKIARIIHEALSPATCMQDKPNKRPYTGTHNSKNEHLMKTLMDVKSAPQQEASVFAMEQYEKYVLRLHQMTEEFSHLLSIFDSDDSDLDGYMTSALLSSAGLETPKTELNLEQLEITIRLNRADIARSKIFLEGKRSKKGTLDEIMFNVIMNDQIDFVNLLLDNGFNLENFLSVHVLERLYTESLKKTDYKARLLKQLWKIERIYKIDWVMLRDIGRVVKLLLGDFYEPLYLSESFRTSMAKGRGYADLNDDKEEDSSTDQERSAKAQEKFESHKNWSDIPIITEARCGSQDKFSADRSNSFFTDGSPMDMKTESDEVEASFVKSAPTITTHQSTMTDSSSRTSSLSDVSSDSTLVEQATEEIQQETNKQKKQRSIEPSMPIPGKRRFIVLPITEPMLRYQPYVSYTNTPEKSDNVKLKSDNRPLGRRYLISVSQSMDSKQSMGGQSISQSTNVSDEANGESPGAVAMKYRPKIFLTDEDVQNPTQTSRVKLAIDSESDADGDTTSIPPLLSDDTKDRKLIPSQSARRISKEIRHKIHSLTATEVAQLKLKDMQRAARQKMLERERRHNQKMAQGKFTLMERLTGKAKIQRESGSMTPYGLRGAPERTDEMMGDHRTNLGGLRNPAESTLYHQLHENFIDS